jgi:hypothetical protein
MMPRYRLTPQFIEAEKVTPETVDAIAAWTGGIKVEEIDPTDSTKKFVAVNFPTMQGNQRASEGEWVVKGTAGTFKKMGNTEFVATYEPI